MRRLVALAALTVSSGVLAAQSVPVRLGGGLSSFTNVPFDVPIEIDWSARADRLGSYTINLRWDPALLRLDAVTPGAFSAITVNGDSALQGVVKIAAANPNGASGPVTVGVVRFAPLQSSSTTILLDVRELAAAGPLFTNALSDAAPQNGLYCPARGYWGDPDGDRSAGSRDALLALSAAVGLDVSAFPEIGLADVDASTAIEARDALIILSHAVGLDVSAFRIMRIAVGACGSDAIVSYAVAPETATVAVNQTLAVQLRATAAGASRTLPDVFWRSSNPSVVLVQQDGQAIAVGPGTATLIGKSGLRDSAIATLTVVARRPTHIVDAVAIVNAIRLGNSEYPFASIEEASFVASDGDTVFVRPGRYLEEAVFLHSATVLGTAPGVRILGRGLSSTALSFYGAGASEVVNVEFDSSDASVWAQQPAGSPPSRLRVVSVTSRDVAYPIQTENVATTVQGADLARGSTGIFSWRGGADTVRASTVDDFSYAIDLEDTVSYAASNTVRRSQNIGIYVFVGGTSTSRAQVTNNTIQQPLGAGIAGEYVDSLEIRGNLIEDAATGLACCSPAGISLYGTFRYHVRVVGNTIRRTHSRAGILISQFDTATVFVDSNAVSAADSAAVQVEGGALVMTGNNIQNNAQYGLNVPFSTGFTHQAHGNAFKANALFAIYTPSDSVDASSNWWGVNGQPPGVGGADAASGRTGDLTPLAAAPSVPPLAPKVPLASAMPRLLTRSVAAAGRAALERFASARAERARWYQSKLDAMRRAAQ